MLDISIVNETSPEANWNRQADRQTGRQADGRTNLCIGRLRLQKWKKKPHPMNVQCIMIIHRYIGGYMMQKKLEPNQNS